MPLQGIRDDKALTSQETEREGERGMIFKGRERFSSGCHFPEFRREQMLMVMRIVVGR